MTPKVSMVSNFWGVMSFYILLYFFLSQPAPREWQSAQLPVQPPPFLRTRRTANTAHTTTAAKIKRSASPIAAPAYTIKSAMRNTTKATTHATAH